MSFQIGKKTIKCNVGFKAEGDLDEQVDVSIVLVYQRPSVKDAKEFSKLNAEFADAVKSLSAPGADTSMVETSEAINAIEQKMSDFVRIRISGWDKVQGGEGEALAFNPENLDLLFNDKDARRAAFTRYTDLVNGRKKEADENLKKSEATG
ncbi:MAG: hypothetical protein OEY66_07175 [Gammaproteobacteria bacterium]|nr:hypothetical protein [Gammaproteobacteria bacterium]